MKRESRKTIRIVVPLSALLTREALGIVDTPAGSPSPSAENTPLVVGRPRPKIDWITVFGIGCMLILTAAGVYSALRQRKSIADRGYGA